MFLYASTLNKRGSIARPVFTTKSSLCEKSAASSMLLRGLWALGVWCKTERNSMPFLTTEEMERHYIQGAKLSIYFERP